MSYFVLYLLSCCLGIILLIFLNELSYDFMKEKIIAKQSWDLNICCGKTDVGKVNADIFKHGDIKNFVLLENVYRLPFREKEFSKVLCSHTIEHIDDPQKFHRELTRVGRQVTYLLPPIWDITAAFNFFEHRWIFLTFKKEHQTLPAYVKLPFSMTYQKYFRQKIKA